MNIEEKFIALIKEVEKASHIAREYFDSDSLVKEDKDDGSMVTEVDKGIERILRNFVQEHFPDDSIIGEEEDSVEGTSGFVWHIDPIDGTDNFLRKIPFCAVSIARLGDTQEDSFAIVHNPITNQTFASLMENGTYENERITNLTAEPLGSKYVIGMGRGRKESWMVPAGFAIQKLLGEKYGRCMPYNCTALELAYISAGRIDAFITYGLHSYDYAAGLYLVKAAGGAISVFENGEWKLWTGSLKELCSEHGRIMFVSHPDINKEMTDLIGDPRAWGETK